MSLGIAKTILVGRLTRDPETKNVGDTTLASFGIAVNRRTKQGDVADFFDVDAWRKLGEFIGEKAKKGDMVYLECSTRQDSFEDKQGQRRTKTKFDANEFRFLPSGRAQVDGSSTGGVATSAKTAEPF
jgi:single-strand DNA-binding protein